MLLEAIVVDTAVGAAFFGWRRRQKTEQAMMSLNPHLSVPVVDSVLRKAAGNPTFSQRAKADKIAKFITAMGNSNSFRYFVAGLLNKRSFLGTEMRSFTSMMKSKDAKAFLPVGIRKL